MSDKTKKIKQAEEEIDRILKIDGSKQPRFSDDQKKIAFFNMFSNTRYLTDDIPPYSKDSRKRDSWMVAMSQTEDHMIGTMQQAVSIEANRGWVLTGGRNQVNRVKASLHNWMVAPGTWGWRAGISALARSFYSTDLNGLVENIREGELGPFRGFAHLDPTRCYLTGDIDYPLSYNPSAEGLQSWKEEDYTRIASFPSIREEMNGLGFCAVSRALSSMLTLIAVQQYDQEQLGARAPKGLLLLMGISEEQWNTAMETRDQDLSAREREYYGGVAILASEGMEEIDAKLIALSQLPGDFNREQFVNLTMYAYALAFGYDPAEFWPIQFGSLGRGTETQIQHEKATAKGGLSFALTFQEQLQELLPPTVQFEFEERDEQGRLLAAQVDQALVEVIDKMYRMQNPLTGDSVLTNEEIRLLLAEVHLIPDDWTLAQEEVTATDEETARNISYQRRMIEKPNVRRAVEMFPSEPIIQYHWGVGQEREVTIWQRGEDALQRRSFPAVKSRQTGDILYDGDGFQITADDVTRAIDTIREDDSEMADLMEAEIIE